MESTIIDQARTQLEPLIREAGLREVAEKADVRHSHISGWLGRKAPMRLERVDRLAAALGFRIVVKLEREASDA